jgi:tRNA (cmo5U34)-methyltransferase
MQIPSEWSFKRDDIADGFDRHVREQLPWYDLMSGAVAHIARHYIPHGGVVYDLGCSTGNIGNLLRQTLETREADFRPIDNSPHMAQKYQGPSRIQIADIAEVEFEAFDVAISFLCLMFIPKKQRRNVLNSLREQVREGGVIIIVDKIESVGGYLGTAISRLTLAGKVTQGVDPSEIIEKELSLMGIQRPLSLTEIPDGVEIFRFGEFAGFVIEAA